MWQHSNLTTRASASYMQQKLEIKVRLDCRQRFVAKWCAEICCAALQDSCEAGEDSILDLVDYCHRKLTLLASKATREGAATLGQQKLEEKTPVSAMQVWLPPFSLLRLLQVRHYFFAHTDQSCHSVLIGEGAGDTKSRAGVWNLPEGRVSAALHHRSHREVWQWLSTVLFIIVAFICNLSEEIYPWIL